MKYILETKRLRLREFVIQDSPFIIELLNSKGWLEFIGDRNVKTTQDAIAYLENGPMKSYQKNGFGLSLVETKTEKQAIGMCGVIRRENLENPDIGFAFLPEFNGKGFAYEIASELMNYAKNQLKIPVIYAIVVENNLSSIKLLEKIGMKFVKRFCFPSSQEELLLFSN